MRLGNRNVKKYVILFVTAVLVTIIIGLVTCMYITNQYNRQRKYFVSNVIANLMEENPQVTDTVINEIFNKSNHKEAAYKELRRYGVDLEHLDYNYGKFDFNTRIYLVIFGTISTTILFVFVMIAFYIKSQNKKILEINSYADKILADNYSLDLRNNEEGELSILKNKIYDITVMLKEKNEILDKEKIEMEKLLSDISHQLKTPLTSLSIITELLYMDIPNDKKQEFLHSMEQELAKLDWLVKTLLSLAKLDSKTLILKKESINVYHMLDKCKENFNALCERYDATIKIIGDNNTKFTLDEKWTMEAIGNIIKNAIEHEGKKVTIEYHVNNFYLQIRIKDNGSGVKKEDISHIFDRFYTSKNSKGSSLGLGLSFAKSIIKNQRGEIKVKSEVGTGTEFVIKLYH